MFYSYVAVPPAEQNRRRNLQNKSRCLPKGKPNPLTASSFHDAIAIHLPRRTKFTPHQRSHSDPFQRDGGVSMRCCFDKDILNK